MPLKGKKPTLIKKRLKTLFYGAAGVGKTTAAIQFPKPYLIDTERGAENDQYVKLLDAQGGMIFQTSDSDELLAEVKSLLTEKHEYKTLIIDPLTVIYNAMVDNAEQKVGSEFGRHFAEAGKQIKRLLNMLMRLDMNVIITSHAKNEYGEGMKVIGSTFDCYKKLDYLFDLVVEIQKRGKERFGIVKKTRVDGFNELENFVFSYDTFATKYGREVLEKDAETETLATKEQVAQLIHLATILKVDEAAIGRWLDKAQATSFEEMETSKIQSCIDALQKRLQTPGVTEQPKTKGQTK